MQIRGVAYPFPDQRSLNTGNFERSIFVISGRKFDKWVFLQPQRGIEGLRAFAQSRSNVGLAFISPPSGFDEIRLFVQAFETTVLPQSRRGSR